MPRRIIRSWYTGRLMGGLLHLVQVEGTRWDAAPPSPLLAVPNITAHPSTASVPITALLYMVRCSALAFPLMLMFNQLLSVACVPDGWKNAIITPVHKKGPNTC